MTQNGFLGTIGWIKGNLLVSSELTEKYDNETFYPGAPDIPDSAKPIPIALAGSIIKGSINDKNIMTGSYNLNKRYGFYGTSGSGINQWISEAVVTFKINNIPSNYNGIFFPVLRNDNSGGAQLELYWDKNNTGRFKVRVATGNSTKDSDPLIEANKYYPSSKKCNRCGEIKKELTLKDRIYKCNKCGLEIDRDINAAINLANYIS